MSKRLMRSLRALFKVMRVEHEMESEMRFHLEMETEENIRRGMSPEEARQAALRRFGGVERFKEECRDVKRNRPLETLWQDARFGARVLRRNPGFTLLSVLTLSLGIGATTLIFSVVNAVLLRPLPFRDADRVIRIEEKHGQSAATLNFTYASFLDLGRQTDALEHIAAARFGTANLTDGVEPERVNSLLVSAEYFSTLGVAPALGRAFLPEEDRPGRNNVVILSHGLWRRRYGADPSLIGKAIKIGGASVNVVGVAPRGFRSGYPFNGEYDLWALLAATGNLSNNRRSHLFGVIGRLRSGHTIEQAQAELGAAARRIEDQNPGVDPELNVSAVRLQDQVVAPIRLALIVFLCAVGLLLLIACANVANLWIPARRAAKADPLAAIRN